LTGRLLHDDLFRRLCRARDYLSAHHDEPVGLESAARQAALSRFHFLRLFRATFGETPHAFVTRVRLDRAKRLLAREEAAVTDVCFEVGFSSLGSFSSLFARRVGCPPSEWRRRMWRLGWDRPRLYIPSCFLSHFGNFGEARPPELALQEG